MTVTVLPGDCTEVLPTLPAGSIHCVITSPPYYALRDYKVSPTLWPEVRYQPMSGLPELTIPGCDPTCDHEWSEQLRAPNANNLAGPNGLKKNVSSRSVTKQSGGETCVHCGGWRGALGLEATPEAYVAHLVHIFRELWRVLRNDGVIWLNIGDSYAAGGNGGGGTFMAQRGHAWDFRANKTGWRLAPPGLKEKDLLGIPWRVAFALQADGWYLRSDVIWEKPDCMPESVQSRPTRSHEYLFLLAKSKRYWYDGAAIREPHSAESLARMDRARSDSHKYADGGPGHQTITHSLANACHPLGRNKRSIWRVNTSQYRGAHFATFPETLAELCLLAGAAPKVCETCGTPWKRVVVSTGHVNKREPHHQPGRELSTKTDSTGWAPSPAPTNDWKAACSCQENAGAGQAMVLDPFGGSGTVGRVARPHGRLATLIELNPAYIDLIEERTDKVQIALGLEAA